MEDSEIEKMLDKCRELRALPPELRHRMFHEFGGFLQDMVDFLVFGKTSEDRDIAAFQEKLKPKCKSYDTESYQTYINLFLEYWQQRE